ncbi:hypothetical protein NZK32_05870 [Cyanobium sp. FGCU-52]|nr:hypothetical protein [Cyanobium sp. FGCU52]
MPPEDSSIALSRLKSMESSTAQAVFIGGIVLIATFANTLVFSSFPLQLLRPDWQLRMAGTFLSFGATALIGVLMVAISERGLSYRASSMATQARLIRKLAVWAAIGYIILIPAQVTAGFRFLGERAEAEKQPIVLWRQLRGRIQATETEAQLRELLGRLPELPPLPEKFDLPLAKVKEELISYTDSKFAARDTQLEKARSERLQNFLIEAIRNSIQSLLLAAGFSAVAKRGTPLDGPGLFNNLIP